MTTAELIGYVASGLIALSITMTSLWRLRIVNLLGGVAMGVYGGLIGAIPVVVVNAFTATVNCVYLWRYARTRADFTTIALPSRETPFLRIFLDRYGEDIRRFHDGFRLANCPDAKGFFVLRDAVTIGLFVFEGLDDGCVCVHVDYVVPGFRDFSRAHFPYERYAKTFREQGYRAFVCRTAPLSPIHLRYLRKIGFQPDSQDPERLIRPIAEAA